MANADQRTPDIDLKAYAARYAPKIAAHLRKQTAFSSRSSNSWAKDVETRIQGMAGGKMLRGILTLIGYEGTGKKITQDTLELASAIELLHAALLVHDDIMDQDLLRRGNPSIYAQYQSIAPRARAAHVGANLGICAGDVALLQVGATLSSLAARSPEGARAAACVHQQGIETGFGQMEDVALGEGITKPTEDIILNMMLNKTARYSCSMPLVAGALLGDGSPKLIKALHELGMHLGLVFQLRDDELGLFGDAKVMGKKAGSDVREGKKTLYRLYLEHVLPPRERSRVQKIYGNPKATAGDIQHIRTLTEQYRIREKVSALMSTYEVATQKQLTKLPVNDSVRMLLTAIAAMVSRRNK
jgi:geranylgeranyl diphosphate synthase type I